MINDVSNNALKCSRAALEGFIEDLKNNNEALYIINYDDFRRDILFGKEPTLIDFNKKSTKHGLAALISDDKAPFKYEWKTIAEISETKLYGRT